MAVHSGLPAFDMANKWPGTCLGSPQKCSLLDDNCHRGFGRMGNSFAHAVFSRGVLRDCFAFFAFVGLEFGF